MAGERYFIGPGLKDKLRETILRVDAITPKESGPTIPTVEQDMMRPSAPPGFRVCTFTGSWGKNTSRTVTLKHQSTTSNTVSATNLLLNIESCGTATSQQTVLIAKEGTAWYYVNHERGCTNSYPATELSSNADCSSSINAIAEGDGAQVLLNNLGCARWVKIFREEVVTDVRWESGIVVQKKYVWVFRDTGTPDEQVIVEATDCEQ